MMTCRQAIDFLQAYLTGELSDGERLEFHLAECPSCVAFLRNYQQTIRMGRAAFDAESTMVPDELVRAILASRPNSEADRNGQLHTSARDGDG